MSESYAALYGKVLAFNCAMMKDSQKAMKYFNDQVVRLELEKTRKRVAEMNRLTPVGDKRSVIDQTKRAPSSLPSSKSRR